MARFRLRRKHKLNPRRRRRARRSKKPVIALKKVRRRRRRSSKKSAKLNPRRRRRRHAMSNPRRRRRRKHALANPRRRRRRARRNPRRSRSRSRPKLPTHKGRARRGSKRYRAIRRRARRGRQLSSGQAAYAAAAHAGRRGGSPLRRLASKTLKKRSGASRGMKAVARAWRSTKVAQRMARGGKEHAYLRAAGLAGVPNPGLGAIKGLVQLLPSGIAGAAGLVGLGFAGAKLGAMAQTAIGASLPAGLVPHVPALTTLVLTGVGYTIVRNVKPLAKYSLPLVIGGFLAAVVQAIANIQLDGPAVGKDPTQPISDSNPAVATTMSLGRKLGLPIGEYTMTGEYTTTGDYTTTGGTDDDSSYDDLRGMDDDTDFADGESPSDLSGLFSKSGIF